MQSCAWALMLRMTNCTPHALPCRKLASFAGCLGRTSTLRLQGGTCAEMRGPTCCCSLTWAARCRWASGWMVCSPCDACVCSLARKIFTGSLLFPSRCRMVSSSAWPSTACCSVKGRCLPDMCGRYSVPAYLQTGSRAAAAVHRCRQLFMCLPPSRMCQFQAAHRYSALSQCGTSNESGTSKGSQEPHKRHRQSPVG